MSKDLKPTARALAAFSLSDGEKALVMAKRIRAAVSDRGVAKVAAEMGVSPTTVESWTGLLRLGPEAVVALERGDISLTRAYGLARLPREEQVRALDLLKGRVSSIPPEAKATVPPGVPPGLPVVGPKAPTLLELRPLVDQLGAFLALLKVTQVNGGAEWEATWKLTPPVSARGPTLDAASRAAIALLVELMEQSRREDPGAPGTPGVRGEGT